MSLMESGLNTESGLKRRAEDDGRPSPADSSSHQSPSISNALRQSPSSRGADLTPSRLGPNSDPRSRAAGRNSPNYPTAATSLPSFENLSAGLPEDDTKRRKVMYSESETEAESRRNGHTSRTGSAGLSQAPLPEARRPSDADFDGSASALARRRGDAAQAKVSKMTIDTGNTTPNASLDQGLHSGSARLWNPRSGNDQPSARSAPPSKISFEDREHHQVQSTDSSYHSSSDADPARHATYSASSNHHTSGSQDPVRSHSSQDGLRNHQLGVPGRAGGIRSEDSNHLSGNSPPTAGRNLLPESSLQGSNRQAPGSARFVPQTATLPSPAYHTTSFMRQQHQGGGPPQATPSASYPPRTAMPNPPPTARLPEHLRSPPSSKTQFLSLFASFYDSLGDSRTLKATLEDQVRRSNSLLQTLQRSSRVLEETVERKVRDERLVWEERTRKLELRVKELEEKVGLNAPSSEKGTEASGSGSGSGSKVGNDGASSTSLEAGASSQNAVAGTGSGTSTTTGRRGGRTNSGKSSSSTSTTNKGKGKATTKVTRARTRRSSASTTGAGEGDDDENQEEGGGGGGGQDAAEDSSKDGPDVNVNGSKRKDEERDELVN